MQKNNHLTDYDEVLDARYGKEGSPERQAFEEEAKAFYAAQLLLRARKEAKVTQSELAKRVGTSKSYISKIENGVIEPGVGLFFRLITALDLRIDISNPIGI
ncbi:XRE family transcriptional regulator [Porphyromonas sp. COT-052 OH4946]|uniref:helix-turn-helix domain-containing protein n=1 Tax=Porphyromonas sp. COT-052 OH4946 TaxID=1515618 RepID=UPI00051DFB27|nr:helix-turn-helix transcriptional regulator [Porphyromonas sp. COT-052 OH4946]KGL55113.1 XRE family transcriptional regulator [Porphyromonas sp. COT-052 OH4946]